MKMRRWVEGGGRDTFSLVTSREEMEQLNRDNRGGEDETAMECESLSSEMIII